MAFDPNMGMGKAYTGAEEEDEPTQRELRRQWYAPDNDRIWGPGNWIECETCPPDASGHFVFHHKNLHNDWTQGPLLTSVLESQKTPSTFIEVREIYTKTATVGGLTELFYTARRCWIRSDEIRRFMDYVQPTSSGFKAGARTVLVIETGELLVAETGDEILALLQ